MLESHACSEKNKQTKKVKEEKLPRSTIVYKSFREGHWGKTEWRRGAKGHSGEDKPLNFRIKSKFVTP